MKPALKTKDVSREKYRVDWNGRKATVRMILRLNLIEAQRQILERGRQNKAVTGIIIGLAISAVIWAVLALLVFET